MHAITRRIPSTDAPELFALARRSGLAASRCDALRRELPAAVDSLLRCRGWEVPEGHLDHYVALGWMTWNGGVLDLTPAGRAMRDLVLARRQLLMPGMLPQLSALPEL